MRCPWILSHHSMLRLLVFIAHSVEFKFIFIYDNEHREQHTWNRKKEQTVICVNNNNVSRWGAYDVHWRMRSESFFGWDIYATERRLVVAPRDSRLTRQTHILAVVELINKLPEKILCAMWSCVSLRLMDVWTSLNRFHLCEQHDVNISIKCIITKILSLVHHLPFSAIITSHNDFFTCVSNRP